MAMVILFLLFAFFTAGSGQARPEEYDYDEYGEEEQEVDYFEGLPQAVDVTYMFENMTSFRTRKDFKGLLAYIRFGLRFSGARRRFGTYQNGNTDDTCTFNDRDILAKACRKHVATQASEDLVLDGKYILRPATLNRMEDCMGDENTPVCCHECLNCVDESCLVEIAGCAAFFEDSLKGCFVPTDYVKGFARDAISFAAFNLRPFRSLMLTIALLALIY